MANKIVQLVDKNSNNLYPVAGAVITDAVSTGAISSQAVTNPKIENGAVNGVENNATAIGTAKLALDTVGTPNLRDASVTSQKIDWATLGFQEGVLPHLENVSIVANWVERNVGTPISFTVEQGATYMILAAVTRIRNKATSGSMSVGFKVSSGSEESLALRYCEINQSLGTSYVTGITTGSTTLTIQRVAYTTVTGNLDYGGVRVFLFRVG